MIVTGANSGIGEATATEFARLEARVLLACKDLKACQETRKKIIADTGNRHVICRECDLASFDSIRKFAERVNEGIHNFFQL